MYERGAAATAAVGSVAAATAVARAAVARGAEATVAVGSVAAATAAVGSVAAAARGVAAATSASAMVAGGGEGAVAAWEVAVIGGGAEGGKLGSEGVGSVAKGGGDMGAGRRRGWREPDSRMRCRDARRAQQFPNGVLLADTLKDASSSEQRLAMRAGFRGEGGGWRRRGLAGLGGGGAGRWVALGRGSESAHSKVAG